MPGSDATGEQDEAQLIVEGWRRLRRQSGRAGQIVEPRPASQTIAGDIVGYTDEPGIDTVRHAIGGAPGRQCAGERLLNRGLDLVEAVGAQPAGERPHHPPIMRAESPFDGLAGLTRVRQP